MNDIQAEALPSAIAPPESPLIEVRDLVTAFTSDSGDIHAIDGVSFRIEQGKTLGLVGESGCGKSITALSIMRLLPKETSKVKNGGIFYRGRNLLSLGEQDMRRVRGNEISMIFQEPMTSLNPVFTIGQQIVEAILLHRKMTKAEARSHAVEMLNRVRIPDPEARLNSYPHEMSGGQRQRVMIAMALSCNPALLIADEPTTALDVTIQAQVLDLISNLQKELGMALLLITHDLGVVAERADRIAIMYSGVIVESGTPDAIFSNPLHPYTIGLMNSVPGVTGHGKRLHAIPGIVPNPARRPSGCRFRDRCSRAVEACAASQPAMRELEPGHWVACHLAGQDDGAFPWRS